MTRLRLLSSLLAGLLSGASSARASEPYQGLAPGIEPSAEGPWIDVGDELPRWATAVRIVRTDETILSAPSGSAPRRGSAAREARLPLFGTRAGPGCNARWIAVGPNAWVCGDHVELARGAPVPASAKTFEPSADGLPYRYYFVGPDGAIGYKKLAQADIGEPDFQLEPGFAVAIGEERVVDGGRYGRSGNEQWIPMRDLHPARPLAFEGAELGDDVPGVIPVAWVIGGTARVFGGPSGARITGESLVEFAKVEAYEEAGTFEKFTRIGENRWVRSKDLRRQTRMAPPESVDLAASERWIDIELASQTLVAYEGPKPVFATIVSSGKGREGTPSETTKGTHRVWVKLASANMDNLEDENANRFYRMESVPYVQFFSKGVGIHGAFWHRSFGRVRSHGCVNLAPRDAQRLFWFTSPRLPAGWTAILPTDSEQGSVVRVR